MSLRDQVEKLLPNWERWYPSLFDAASDLGIIKAEVCDPNNLLLTRRHQKVRQRAEDAKLDAGRTPAAKRGMTPPTEAAGPGQARGQPRHRIAGDPTQVITQLIG